MPLLFFLTQRNIISTIRITHFTFHYRGRFYDKKYQKPFQGNDYRRIADVCPGIAASGDVYTGWTNQRDYALNAAATGITTNVVNFPVLIRLTSADSAVFNSATTPTDLRFAKGSNLNVAFPYQVERWDATDKLAEVWVLVDTVFPGSQQSLRMYWGNATATAASNGAAVFNPANGFVAVWHLQDLTDATGNGYTLSNNAGATKSAGIIDSGYTFVGASKQYLYVKSLLGTPATTTISCWECNRDQRQYGAGRAGTDLNGR